MPRRRNRSKNTGKLRTVEDRDGNHLLSMRAEDGLMILRAAAARNLHGSTEAPAHRVVVEDETSPFNREGKNVFAKFVKGFFRAGTGETFGYNIPALQNGPHGPWLLQPTPEEPKRFGFYLVQPVDAASRENAHLHAILLDYSRGGNFVLDPAGRLRDYLVRVHPGSDDLLLGKAFLAVGPLRIQSNFFLLERHRPSDYVR